VIDPAGADPIAFDREHVIVLSDHSQMTGEQIFRKLKQMGGAYFNYQRRRSRAARGSGNAAQGPDRVGRCGWTPPTSPT
jgi:FtsP/CotA-like multicopper oxidase with cupredoxin domain